MEERIARHADIDTRRAMGFPPRKVVIPDLNLKFLQKSDLGRMAIYLDNARIVLTYPCHRFDDNRGIYPRIQWGFRLGGYIRYYEMYQDGVINTWKGDRGETSRHPDFNEDGTLKAWQTYIH